jgi:hypothetical protein
MRSTFACVPALAALLHVLATPAASAQAGDPAVAGAWSCRFDWSPLMGPPPHGGGPIPVHHALDEVAHAALIPVGPHQGKVLLWNFKLETQQTHTFVFDPLASPDCSGSGLIEIADPVPANIFCAGQTFLPDGSLMVAGGIPSDGDAEKVFRFTPRDGGRWVAMAPMLLPRFYPTLVLLNRRPLATGGGHWQVPGSSVLAIGGPFSTHSTAGQPIWESLAHPFASSWELLAPSATLGCIPLPGHPYLVLAPLGCADVRFDSYPRALQMSSGDLFLAGDVDTVPHLGQSPDGRTWFARPPGVGPLTEWTLSEGPWMTATGSGLAQDAHQRFYAPAVLLHTAQDKDRILVFGGSDLESVGCDVDALLFATPTVEELRPALAQPIPGATWQPKAPLVEPRVFHNAVVLPTGEVLITGGQRAVVSGCGEFENVPVYAPELYEAGAFPTDPGSSRMLAQPPTYPVEGGGPPRPTDRLYHHVSVLLPDGRVLVAGGEKKLFGETHSDHTGEIYSPPYLFQGVRPRFDDAPTEAALSTTQDPKTFTIKIRAPVADTLDRIVLLRPAAVTHHFDADQRYIELEHTVVSSSFYVVAGQPPMKVSTISVRAPLETLAPQGWYMLFVVHQKPTAGHRVPSTGQFIRFM